MLTSLLFCVVIFCKKKPSLKERLPDFGEEVWKTEVSHINILYIGNHFQNFIYFLKYPPFDVVFDNVNLLPIYEKCGRVRE